MHEDHYERLPCLASYVHAWLKDYDATRINTSVAERQGNKIARWDPLKDGWLKLNTNGTNKDNKGAGCGGIIQDKSGNCKCDFYINVENCNVLRAELWGEWKCQVVKGTWMEESGSVCGFVDGGQSFRSWGSQRNVRV